MRANPSLSPSDFNYNNIFTKEPNFLSKPKRKFTISKLNFETIVWYSNNITGLSFSYFIGFFNITHKNIRY